MAKSNTPKSILEKWASGCSTGLSPDDIMNAVVKVTGIKEEMIYSRFRYPNVVRARHLYWAGLRHYCKMSYPEIASLCNVHHTAAIHGVKCVPKEVSDALGEYCQQPD